jgi:hypothetical protein
MVGYYKRAMASIPGKVEDRLIAGIKRFQTVLSDAKKRDAGEADTVTVVIEMLSEVFGYDKFSEITAEHAVKGTFCDLALKIDGAVSTLIEVKAIGIDLKDNHVAQAVNYAVHQPVSWVILTNGIAWRIYRVLFSKPIGQEKVVDINFLELKPKEDFETLFLWSKEGWKRTALEDYEAQQQARSPFLIAATILSDPVLEAIRRQLKKVAKLNKTTSDVKIDLSQIDEILTRDVIKREVLEDPKANEARKKVEKAGKVSLHSNGEDADEGKTPAAAAPVVTPTEPVPPVTNVDAATAS